MSALVNFDGDTVTVSGSMPDTASAERMLAFVEAANAAGKPIVNTLVITPNAPGGDSVRFVGLDSVPFPEGSPVIGPTHAAELDRLAQLLAGTPELRIVVVGRSDQRGSDEANLEVSVRRGEAVVAYLITRGVDSTRLAVVGVGETQLTSTGRDDDSLALNRRPEFVISGFAGS